MSNRLPWHDEPKIDHRKAAESALRAARPKRVDLNNAALQAWAAKAFDDEIDKVKHADKRNDQLFKSSASLFEIVAAGALDEDEVTNALRDACRDNGLERDDGAYSVGATIKSGRRHGFDSPRDLSNVGKHNGFHVKTEAVQSIDLTDAFDLERGFWTSRDSLQMIYLAALSRMCAPWAVLGNCAARALALVRPHVVLPAIVGGVGSLNWFCALAARSGGGKSSAASVAYELVNQYVYTRNLGSGEGLVDSFFCREDDDHPSGRRESVMFVADEIDSMTALGQRSGSTLMGTLRSAFNGATLGFSYRGRDVHLEEHTYRMTMVINVQTARAGTLFNDKHGGTLQRFMWFPATDPRITTETPLFPGSLTLPSPSSWQYRTELTVPYETIELIKDERARQNAGLDDDPLGGHALFIREKLAYALAILDGRDKMNLEDWRLAGIASKVSDHTRSWVESELRSIQDEEDTERGRRQGVSLVAADEERTAYTARRTNRIAQWALKKVTENDGTMTERALMRSIASRDKPYLPSALDKLADDGLVTKAESTNKSGPKGYTWTAVK